MSTSEYRSVDAESELPISAAELAALATQLYAASIRPGPDSPPQAAPVAPRGSVPDATAATSAGQAAVSMADPFPAPVPLVGVGDIYVPAPTSAEPEGAPQTVPVAPRGNVPDATAAPSAAETTGSVADPYLPPGIGDLSAFAVPTEGIVPTVPGVLAGTVPTVPVAPHGAVPSRPEWPHEAPSVPDLGWSDAVPAVPHAPAGDEHNYYFLTKADPVPQLPDEHEVFDVNAVRADFPILQETVNGKPLIWFDNAATTQKPRVVIDRLSHSTPTRIPTFTAPHTSWRPGRPMLTKKPGTRRGDSSARPRTKRSFSCAAPPKPSTWWPMRGAASIWNRVTRSSSPT
jgi:cysteine desulfurase / selenocysteine lyase